MNLSDLIEDEKSLVTIDMNPPLATVEASPGLSELLARVEKFIVIPGAGKMKPMELSRTKAAKRVKAIEEVAKVLVVSNDEQFQIVGTYASECVEIQKAIVERWADAKAAAHKAHKTICAMEEAEIDAKDIIKLAAESAMKAYRLKQRQEQEAREREAQRLQDEEARKLREAAELEAKKQAELEEQAKAARAEGDIRTAKALVAEASEVAAKVEDLAVQADVVQNEVPAIEDTTPKIAGRQERWPWVGECTDPMALIKAVAAGTVPLEYELPQRGGGTKKVLLLEPNSEVINWFAKRLEANAQLAGCTFKQDLVTAYRGK